jgi:hypothetical protein
LGTGPNGWGHQLDEGVPGCLANEPKSFAGFSDAGIAEDFSIDPPVSPYGSTKRASETLALEYGAAFGFPVWINRCGVLADAGQFGTAEQGIFFLASRMARQTTPALHRLWRLLFQPLIRRSRNLSSKHAHDPLVNAARRQSGTLCLLPRFIFC